jgi:hypothetical protein
MTQPINSFTRLCILTAIAGVAFFTNAAPAFAAAAASSTSPELKAIHARAEAARAKVNPKDPKAFKQAQAELAKVRADLAAYAKGHGLKLTAREYTHPVADEQRCRAGNENCTLVEAYVDKNGVLHCVFDCIAPATTVKQ